MKNIIRVMLLWMVVPMPLGATVHESKIQATGENMGCSSVKAANDETECNTVRIGEELNAIWSKWIAEFREVAVVDSSNYYTSLCNIQRQMLEVLETMQRKKVSLRTDILRKWLALCTELLQRPDILEGQKERLVKVIWKIAIDIPETLLEERIRRTLLREIGQVLVLCADHEEYDEGANCTGNMRAFKVNG